MRGLAGAVGAEEGHEHAASGHGAAQRVGGAQQAAVDAGREPREHAQPAEQGAAHWAMAAQETQLVPRGVTEAQHAAERERRGEQRAQGARSLLPQQLAGVAGAAVDVDALAQPGVLVQPAVGDEGAPEQVPRHVERPELRDEAGQQRQQLEVRVRDVQPARRIPPAVLEERVLPRQPVALQVRLARHEAVVQVAVQQPSGRGVQRDVVLDGGVAHSGGGREPLEAGARQDRLRLHRLAAVDQQVQVGQAAQTGGDVLVALPVAVGDTGVVDGVEQLVGDEERRGLRARGGRAAARCPRPGFHPAGAGGAWAHSNSRGRPWRSLSRYRVLRSMRAIRAALERLPPASLTSCVRYWRSNIASSRLRVV